MKLFKDKKIEDKGTVSGFHVNCNCDAVHMRNGEIVKPENKFIKKLKKIIFKVLGN